MKPDVLEAYIQQYIESQDTFEVTFAWQGGEPTLLGLDYFRKILECKKIRQWPCHQQHDSDEWNPAQRRLAPIFC
jgi:sulfatase maturation enzyme AslB (radical SAM superfamily)